MSHGNTFVGCWTVHSAVGSGVMPKCTIRRSCASNEKDIVHLKWRRCDSDGTCARSVRRDANRKPNAC
jgi:hypothetical protein